MTEKSTPLVGKNFSANNVSGKRRKADFYETPFSITRQFLEAKKFPLSAQFLEPATGNGAIATELERFGYPVTQYDVEKDFFTETGQFDIVFTNPPYSLAQEFIVHAKKVAQSHICFLLPLSYLHGKKRFDNIYSDKNFPLAEVWVFTRYPMLGDSLRADGKYRTGMMVYAWFVFSKDHQAAPSLHWLDNNQFVLGAKDIRQKVEATQ